MRAYITAIFLICLANFLCLPLWTEYNYGSFVRTIFNKEARLGFVYLGRITAEEPIHFSFQDASSNYNVSWTYGNSGVTRNACINLRARREWQKISFRVEALSDGKISMVLSGPDNRDDYGNLYYIPTDWQNIKISGKIILPKHEAFSCKKPFTKQVSVKKGDVIQIEGEFRRHHFSVHDFTRLSSGNFWYLITSNLLIFFLIYRLFDYFVKQRESLRLSDSSLVVTFFLVLFIPMTDVSNETKSIRENRVLAVKPRIREIFKEGANTGGGYEKWFNDHFCGRTALIKLHDFIGFSVNSTIRNSKAVWFKENGWLMQLPEFGSIMNPTLSRSIQTSLIQLNQFCQKNKIKLYVLEVPKREIVYKDIFRDKYGFNEKTLAKLSKQRESIRRDARLHGIPYIHPYNALCDAAKQDLVFFQRSIHLTETGGFIAYKELMQAILRDFPDMPVVSLNDCRRLQSKLIRDNWHWTFDYGNLFYFFGFKDDPDHKVIYDYYNHEKSNELMVKVEGRHIKNFSYPKGQHRIMIAGTSNNHVICRFLPFSAAETKFIQLNMIPVPVVDQWKFLKLFKKDILCFKPDILILSICTDNLPRLRDLCSTK